MIMRIILAAMIALSLLLPTTTLAHALDKDLLKLMPKDLSKDMVNLSKNELASCTPFSQHQNDNVTLIQQTGATDTCYNVMAGIADYCDPNGSGLMVGNDICSDPQLADFKNNYYDPINRPFNSFEGVQNMLNHMPKTVDAEFNTLSNATIPQCTPYSQHQNDNFTFHGPDATTTQTCYNALAYIVYNCQIANATTICNNNAVVDFSKNCYDPVNRPYDKTAWELIENNSNSLSSAPILGKLFGSH